MKKASNREEMGFRKEGKGVSFREEEAEKLREEESQMVKRTEWLPERGHQSRRKALGPAKAELEAVSFSRYPGSAVRAMPQKQPGYQNDSRAITPQIFSSFFGGPISLNHVGTGLASDSTLGISFGLVLFFEAVMNALARIIFPNPGVNVLHINGNHFAKPINFLLQSMNRLVKQLGEHEGIEKCGRAVYCRDLQDAIDKDACWTRQIVSVVGSHLYL